MKSPLSALTAAGVALAFGFPVDAAVFNAAHGPLPPAAIAAMNSANARFAAADDAGDIASMSAADLDRAIATSERLLGVIRADADREGRDLNAREERRLSEAEEALAFYRAESDGRRPAGRKTLAEPAQDATTAAQAAARSSSRVYAAPRSADPRKGGFESVGHFLNAVVAGSAQGAVPDPRLFFNATPTSFGAEGTGADGGFAVPPEFRATIMQKVLGEDSLLSLTDQQTVSGNGITFPADETSPWQQTGGIQAYWEAEAGQKTQSKPQLVDKTVKTNKLIALVPVTDELLDDAPAMASYVTRKAPDKINFKVNDAIINGTGVGMPLGILNSPGTVVVAKEAGQTAATVVFANILKVFTSIDPAARRKAVWLISPDVEQTLYSMQFPGTGTAVPVFLPPGGLSGSPYAALLGRPIMPTQAAQPLGSQGDIVFGDLSNYLTVVKAGGIKTDVSIHIFFDYDITAFSFVFRVGGMPWWNSPIQPYQVGARARGFFATLATRA